MKNRIAIVIFIVATTFIALALPKQGRSPSVSTHSSPKVRSKSAKTTHRATKTRKTSSESSLEKEPSESGGTRLDELEKEVAEMQAELEVLSAHAQMLIQRTNLSIANRFYLKSGFSLILPRSPVVSTTSATGLGMFTGMGLYFGASHVVDFGLEWDLYPAVSLRYRFELHYDNPMITWGPVIGYKIRLAPAGPIDSFLTSPDDVKTSFPFIGGVMSFPIGRSLFQTEVIYLVNNQSFVFLNVGVQFFL